MKPLLTSPDHATGQPLNRRGPAWKARLSGRPYTTCPLRRPAPASGPWMRHCHDCRTPPARYDDPRPQGPADHSPASRGWGSFAGVTRCRRGEFPPRSARRCPKGAHHFVRKRAARSDQQPETPSSTRGARPLTDTHSRRQGMRMQVERVLRHAAMSSVVLASCWRSTCSATFSRTMGACPSRAHRYRA